MRRLCALPSSLSFGLDSLVFVSQAAASPPVHPQSTALLQGTVVDQKGAVVPRAQISAKNTATGLVRVGETDDAGNYQIAALPIGNYRMEVRAGGFFDLFNHASFGQPSRVVGNGTFGTITNTRFPTGDPASSRQVQLVLKLMF